MQRPTTAFLTDLLTDASRVALEHFGQSGTLYTKTSPSDVVTAADLAVNELITARIQAAFPRHSLVSEEQPGDGAAAAGGHWLIDPIDGTLNFATRTPLFGIMVAFAVDHQLELAGIALPATHDLYLAERGRGTTKNGQPIHCSERTEFAHSYGCTGARLSPQRAAQLRKLLAVLEREPFWMNAFGSAAVTAGYVADGRRDWSYSSGAGSWDYAAPALVMAEAGCTVTNMEGRPWSIGDASLVAGAPALQPRLLEILRA